MAHILDTDGMAAEGIEALTAAGHQVDSRKLNADELLKAIDGYDALVVRSATKVTREVLTTGAPRLKLVGRAGVGVDNIDVTAATEAGVIVMNTPLGNILSAAEHTIGMIFAVSRNIPQAHARMQEGVWDKKAFVGNELHGKTLGIVGLGKIGQHVASVLKAAGMAVLAHDPFLSQEVADRLQVEPVALDELLARADVITLHVPLTDKTANLIDAAALERMKPGARLVNVARGGIVDEPALAAALKEGQIAAAAFDVFANEPLEADSPLRGLKNCILTPHLGASTAEAQVKVSTDIAQAFNRYFADGSIQNAINVKLTVDPALDGYLQAAEQLGAALVQTLDQPLRGLEVRGRGELADFDIRPLAIAALKGALARICEQPVNLVNAELIAEQRGIELTASSTSKLRDWSARLAIKATTAEGDHIIGGSLVDGVLRIQRFDDYQMDLPIGGHLLLMEYPDRPGMVGRFASILGDNHINIARMEVSRIDGRGDALTVVTLDDPVSGPVLEAVRAAVKPTRVVTMSL